MRDGLNVQHKSLQTEEQKNSAAFEKLVRKAVRGNKDALYSLCRAIALRVLFRAEYVLRNRADAEDAAQEIMIRVCEKIHELKKPEAFYAWLNSIIMNETRRIMRKNSKQDAVLNISDHLDVLEEDEKLEPLEYTIREEDRKLVMEIVGRLPERQRQAIVLYYYEGFNVTQTAEIMEISHSNVSRYLKLARDKVKKELEHEESTLGIVTGARSVQCASSVQPASVQQALGKPAPTQQAVGKPAPSRSISAKPALAKTSTRLALLPMGSLLAQTMQQEATQITPENVEWFKRTMSNCLAVIGSRVGAVGAAMLGVPAKIAGGITVALLAAAVVFAGMWFGGIFQQPQLPMAVPDVDGEIIFTGGNTSREHVNPTRAIAEAADEYGALTVYSWEIITLGSGEVMFSGTKSVIDTELVQMLAQAMNGDYVIRFYMGDAAGNTGWLSRQFTISVEP